MHAMGASPCEEGTTGSRSMRRPQRSGGCSPRERTAASRVSRLAESECMKMARLTGERPMAGATPDSLLAFHDAGYREMRERLGVGTVLDVGCGVGDQTARLAGLGRL